VVAGATTGACRFDGDSFLVQQLRSGATGGECRRNRGVRRSIIDSKGRKY